MSEWRRAGSIKLIEVVRTAIAGSHIWRGTQRAELNSALACGARRGFYQLGHGRELGAGPLGIRCPRREIGKPGQDAKIDFHHAFLLDRLHLQGILPDHAGLGATVSNNAKE